MARALLSILLEIGCPWTRRFGSHLMSAVNWLLELEYNPRFDRLCVQVPQAGQGWLAVAHLPSTVCMQHTLDFKPPSPQNTSHHCDAYTVFSSTRLPAPSFLAPKEIHTLRIPWKPRSPIVLDRTRSFIQITVFVHVGRCMPIPGFIDKATCFISPPFFLLLTSWLTRREQVVTPLYTFFRVSGCMHGSLSRISVFVP